MLLKRDKTESGRDHLSNRLSAFWTFPERLRPVAVSRTGVSVLKSPCYSVDTMSRIS
jgi:hypothetical protein